MLKHLPHSEQHMILKLNLFLENILLDVNETIGEIRRKRSLHTLLPPVGTTVHQFSSACVCELGNYFENQNQQ